MNFENIAANRLFTQKIALSDINKPQQLVNWMGVMQAQDFAMSKWAIGIRINGIHEKAIEESMNKGEILRTHVLRPTWHLVSSKDIHWMLELSAPQIKTISKSHCKELELTNEIFRKCNSIIEKAMCNGEHLSREEIVKKLENAKIKTTENRTSLILINAEINGLICSGIIKEKKQTYALLDQRVPKKISYNREEALGELALRYFTSHGPATIQDFTWWSGLSIRDAKIGLESNKSKLMKESVNDQTYYFASTINSLLKYDSIKFLPAYDEFIISYKDRSASLDYSNQKDTISNNGIFRPVIIHNGKVIGLWSRTLKKDKVLVTPTLFKPEVARLKSKIEKACDEFASFLELKMDITM